MKITSPCNDEEALKKLQNKKHYDYFICGSDQIWNPIAFSPILFAGNFDDGTVKIAYAVSSIDKSLEKSWECELQKMAPYIQKFSAISVREKGGINLFGKHTDIPIYKVLDPTLLLPSTNWKSMLQKHKNTDPPYIFCYFLGEYTYYTAHIKKIMKKYGLKKIIKTCDSEDSFGPDDWLNYIANAEIVITDSFHGMVFSIIFKKTFYCVKRKVPEFAWPRRKGMWPWSNPERLHGLLETFGLEERFISDISDIDAIGDINYAEVFRIWKNERKKSLKWLKDALE